MDVDNSIANQLSMEQIAKFQVHEEKCPFTLGHILILVQQESGHVVCFSKSKTFNYFMFVYPQVNLLTSRFQAFH